MGSGSFMGSGGSVSDDSKAMPQTLDTASYDYDKHVWNNPDVMVYQAPTGTWEQSAIRQANIVVTMPRAQLQKMVKPPLPQLSPKGVRRRPSLSIEDVLGATDTYEDRRAFFSGSAAGYQGSPRNADGVF